MKEIHIASNEQVYTAFVDDEDYPVVSRFHWNILFSGERPYAFAKLYCENFKGKTLLMHHLVMGNSNKHDHIDNNSLNNQKLNLRPATWQQNGWNKGKPNFKNRKSTSKFKGVVYRPLHGKDRWQAFFKHVEPGKHKSTGKVIYIGFFDSEIEAAKAYNREIVKYRGEWAWQNPIPSESIINQ